MFDFLDKEIWIGLLILTAMLYLARFLQSRNKRTVYRISPESLKRSREVMLKILPLVEDEDNQPIIDNRQLPYPKDNVKSAAKILAYYYWKKNQQTELQRVKNAFISLSRFQDSDMEHEEREREQTREQEILTREFECYLTHSPFNGGKGKAA